MPELPARGRQRSLLTTCSFYFFQGLKLAPILPNKSLEMRVFLMTHTPASEIHPMGWHSEKHQPQIKARLKSLVCHFLGSPAPASMTLSTRRVRCRGFGGGRGGRVQPCSCKALSSRWKQARQEEPPQGLRAVTGRGPQGSVTGRQTERTRSEGAGRRCLGRGEPAWGLGEDLEETRVQGAGAGPRPGEQSLCAPVSVTPALALSYKPPPPPASQV